MRNALTYSSLVYALEQNVTFCHVEAERVSHDRISLTSFYVCLCCPVSYYLRFELYRYCSPVMHCPNWRRESIRIVLYSKPIGWNSLKRIFIEFSTLFIVTRWLSLRSYKFHFQTTLRSKSTKQYWSFLNLHLGP